VNYAEVIVLMIYCNSLRIYVFRLIIVLLFSTVVPYSDHLMHSAVCQQQNSWNYTLLLQRKMVMVSY